MFKAFLCNGLEFTKTMVLLYCNSAYYTYNSNGVEDTFTSVEHWIEFRTDLF